MMGTGFSVQLFAFKIPKMCILSILRLVRTGGEVTLAENFTYFRLPFKIYNFFNGIIVLKNGKNIFWPAII